MGLLCLLLALPAHAAVYRCEVEGRKLYLDRPCEAGGRPHALPALGVMPAGGEVDLAMEHDARRDRQRAARDQDDAAWLKAHRARKAVESRMNAAISEHRVLKDMSADQVRRALGSPDEVKRNNGVERWTYVEGKKRRTVVLEDGKVSSAGAGRGR